jgi:hypothetical protein
MTGNCHVHKAKGSPFEHNPHDYHVGSPLGRGEHEGVGEAVRKGERLAGIRQDR